uniref:Uncharacterized protein n=1 Tax=Triticum urartu TaxID=4572 RepID=A0A8R7K047_TRIUA
MTSDMSASHFRALLIYISICFHISAPWSFCLSFLPKEQQSGDFPFLLFSCFKTLNVQTIATS